MQKLIDAPPITTIEDITDVLHGVAVTDSYRWLEDRTAPRTRTWLEEQTHYARAYLDAIPGREVIRRRICDYLAVEGYDTPRKVGTRYFFRKRMPNDEQPGIYMREGTEKDQLLVDPAQTGTDRFTAIQLVKVSQDGRLLLYQIKQGGERTGVFEVFDVESRTTLPDRLALGHLRAFAFAPNSLGFYYVHETVESPRPHAIYYHALGRAFEDDEEIFSVPQDPKLRVGFTTNRTHLFIFVHRSGDTNRDIYVHRFGERTQPQPIALGMKHLLSFLETNGPFIAVTDREAPNRLVVELRPDAIGRYRWVEVVPERENRIEGWTVCGDLIVLSYLRRMTHQVLLFDRSGQKVDEIPVPGDKTLRLAFGSAGQGELFLEIESFTEPVEICRYSPSRQDFTVWARKNCPLTTADYESRFVWYRSKDGTEVPMHIVGRRDVLQMENRPTVMTAYGGYGFSMTPQFSVLASVLMERGCVFALPHIRGGGELGSHWHHAARQRNRQTAFDDFLSAAEWLVESKRTDPRRLGIFGGSNGGLLVGAALTQRPSLFAAALCIAPILDMLRYHLFDRTHHSWQEFGTSEDRDHFAALSAYSPYHRVTDGEKYPATMIVSGDADQTCDPLHARKMTARLQAASSSGEPILLDYQTFRGHAPVLPLRERIDSLTDRIAFLCERLGILTEEGGSDVFARP